MTKQIEGTYPNWRNITDDVRQFSGYIEISDQAAEAISRIVPRLPGDDTPNHTVGLYCVSGRLYLRGSNKDQERATEVEVPGVTVSGDPATVYVNRQYLLKAIGFGLRQIGVQEPLKPLRFSDGGSRQMIVMPVRVDANVPAPKASAPAPVPVSPITPTASTNAPDQPETINENHQPEGRNTTMQNGNTNGSGEHPAAETSPIGEKSQLGAGARPDRVRERLPPGCRHEPEQFGRHVAPSAARTPSQRAGDPLRARHPQGVTDRAPVVSTTTHPNEPKGRMPP